jgi:hypothetical protein
VKLRGILDFSLGNFLCLRGFAPLGVLYDISEPAASIQRDLINEHRDEMTAFLRQGEYLFFPELILCTTLLPDGYADQDIDYLKRVQYLFEKATLGENISTSKFHDFSITSKSSHLQKPDDTRSVSYYQTATLSFGRTQKYKFARIDGNHRLSATPEDGKFRSYNTPYCLIFFRTEEETARFSRALFHNINYKQIPLTMEQNLKLILDDATALFPDETLKTSSSFGWAYYLARKLNNHLDFDLVPNLKSFIEKEQRTFLVEQFSFLISQEVLGENENAIKRYKDALAKVNTLIDQNVFVREAKNPGLLSALVYYELHQPSALNSFLQWVSQNHIHLIERSSGKGLIQIFDKILESRQRTIFVSMPFGKDVTENHYKIIERVCNEINLVYQLRPHLIVRRVDWFQDGTSYVINNKIIEMMSDCGLLIGDLTLCNPNVYHEIGFIMGKAKAEGSDTPNMLLFLDESVPDEKDKFVGFNLSGVKQLRFKQTEEFAEDLRENIERFYKLKA